MNPKIELALLNQLSQFVGKKLKSVKLKETKINGKDVFLLGLVFPNSVALVLALDKDVILSNYKSVGEKL